MRRCNHCNGQLGLIVESPFAWLSLTSISAPPRDPNNNNDEDEEDEEDDKREPAVIREPDEDE
jgi:hypothetical protein